MLHIFIKEFNAIEVTAETEQLNAITVKLVICLCLDSYSTMHNTVHK